MPRAVPIIALAAAALLAAPAGALPAQLCGGSGSRVRIDERPREAVAFGDRPRIGGRVRGADGAEVRLIEVGPGLRELKRTRTDRTGRFAVRLPRGSSRTLRVGVATGSDGTLSCSREFHVDVEAGVTLKAPRAVRGRRIRFSGRLRAPERGLEVELEAVDRGRWRHVESTQTNRRGRFMVSYRTTSARRFRARVPEQPPYPYAAGTSRTVSVRVAQRENGR